MSQTQQVEHTDSISSQDPNNETAKKTKSRRPPNTAFRQQRLKAWQPILTPKTVLPIFFIVGIIFAPIGGLLLYASSQVQEIALDYTNCATEAPNTTLPIGSDSPLKDMPSNLVSQTFKKDMKSKPQWARAKDTYKWESGKEENANVCVLEFNVPEDIKGPIYFYYRLNNFYQNHRRYVKSFDVDQLKGDAKTGAQIKSGECDPLDVAPDGRPYYPCGLIANSMFNDTYGNLTALNVEEYKTYNLTQNGISWSSEGDLYGETKYKPTDVVPPPNWADQYPEDGYDSTTLPNLHTWGAFQVWMRTAGLPTFSKLAGRNDDDVLKTGTYRLQIYDRFPATKYGGKKEVLFSTRTVVGGRNSFLGIAYVVVGGLCILLGTIFTLTHLVKPR
ncbi:alkylphosphocholine resistance protein lem3 [Didymosphaeria variabile]|uniref:Alkylphosphocholine resistance protein lem3 n=1 Tax=Didymosphaeria variabile TaxID=1932322 RepID=A0A9W8XEG6_9PLEO|nr:alkylphosphocholine resistance protein lem3 [Didymosphaeria variabile]KAJ4348663.1 alkylphosphocholine resistance protein lem3 [Didymosphaeria variabile]